VAKNSLRGLPHAPEEMDAVEVVLGAFDPDLVGCARERGVPLR
jgi:hypothetical protein